MGDKPIVLESKALDKKFVTIVMNDEAMARICQALTEYQYAYKPHCFDCEDCLHSNSVYMEITNVLEGFYSARYALRKAAE
jgi:hypothetical protein